MKQVIQNIRSGELAVETTDAMIKTLAQPLLVTGCAGFVGSRVCDQLLEGGSPVVGVDNFNDYYDKRLKKYRRDRLLKFPQFEFVDLDIEDRQHVNLLFERHAFRTVFNLAARAGVRYSLTNPHVYFSTNVCGALNLLEAMKGRAGGKYVLASTSSLYAGQKMPFVETLPVDQPISPYAASKRAAEVLAYTYHTLYGIDVSILRYFTVYGPVGRPDMSVFRFIRWIDQGQPIKLFGDGTQSRDFTFIDDVARGTILAGQPLGFEIVNLGGGSEPISLIELIRMIESELGKKAIIERLDFHCADMKSTWADVSKARNLIGWEPRVSVEEGIRRSIRWYRDNLPFVSKIAL